MGFLDKLFGKEKKKSPSQNIEGKVKFLGEESDKITHTMPIETTTPKEHYVIKHEGEYMVFDSKEEMPEEIREVLDDVEKVECLKISSIYHVIVDGKRRSYNSLTEVPEEIRKIIEEKRS